MIQTEDRIVVFISFFWWKRVVACFGCGNAGEDSWDAHGELEKNHRMRGLLDTTLVVWHTEFGRMPISQSVSGRDHSPYCFSVWLAGGGVKAARLSVPPMHSATVPQSSRVPSMICTPRFCISSDSIIRN